MSTIFYSVVIFQLVYFLMSGEYITLLALENISQAYVVVDWKHILALISIIFVMGIYTRIIYSEKMVFDKRYNVLITAVCILVVMIQNGIFVSSNKYIYGTPLGSFLGKLYYFHFDDSNNDEYRIRTKIESYINRENIFENELPFHNSENYIEKPNIIILFTEGTSARLIGCYGGNYKNLTPNIDEFSTHSMKVINYFNHTAATFRGTHGQIASCFPKNGGYGKDQWSDKNNKEKYMYRSYQTLPNILNGLGYKTYFLSPHRKEDPYTNLLKMLKFKKVYVAEDYGEVFGTKYKEYHNSIRDLDMYKNLRLLMEDSSDDKPFLICMYTLNTHAFMDVYEGGKKYEIDNRVLDTLHNLDYCFGDFWNWFKESEYAKNTILILTTDHAHYYEKPYLKLMENEKNYKRYFVDKIPLFVYDPTHILPKEYDVYGKTSLNLIPSVLHLLGLKDIKNSFLGKSLFEERKKGEINISAIGKDFYYIKDNEVYEYRELIGNGYIKEIVENKVNTIKDYYYLEDNNSVFKE